MPFTIADGGVYDDAKEERDFKIKYKATDYHKIKNGIKNSQLTFARKKMSEYDNFIEENFPAYFGGPASQIFVHIDFDAFFVSCELLNNEHLKGKAVAVGNEYMIAAASYEARKYGIRSGMPGYHGKILCPHLIFLPANMTKYKNISEKIMQFLAIFDENIEIYGIDEVYISFSKKTFERAQKKIFFFTKEKLKNNFSFEGVGKLISKIRTVIYELNGLTCSAGISICRGMAKYSTSINKPNGQFILKNDFKNFLARSPVRKLNGIGQSTEYFLQQTENILTIGDLYDKIIFFYFYFPERSFFRLYFLSRGFSDFDIRSEKSLFQQEPKSIGNSKSFSPTDNDDDIRMILYNLCEMVASRLGNFSGQVISIQLTYRQYDTFQKQQKLKQSISTLHEIFERVSLLYNSSKKNDLLRNIMVRVGGLRRKKKQWKKNIQNEQLKCFLCNEVFIQQDDFIFLSHVNICLNKQKDSRKLYSAQRKKNGGSLLLFFKKK